MTEPLHDLCHAFHAQSLGELRPRDHDDGQAERARRVDLGACAVAAGIAGDDPCDTARSHHLEFALKRERPARHDDIGCEWQRAFGRIDEPQRVGVVRFLGEWRDMLPADREEDSRCLFGQRCDRGGDIRDVDPVVVGRPDPGRALERDQWRSGFCARRDRVAAHLGREWMCGIDDMRDALLPNVIRKSGRAAEAADADRQRLPGGGAGTAAIGIDCVKAGARDLRGEQIRVKRSAQDEGARHG